jgi:hypothetical protein
MHFGLIDRLTAQLKDSGTPAHLARDAALLILRNRGHVYRDSERLTAAGQRRESLGAAGRAIDRAAKASGKHPSAFTYDPRTNRATLK